MAELFDPYYKWLGIPAEDQPVNHYRLLGIKLFEADPDVISEAADQRMAHLRTHQTGQYRDLSQRLLNEVAAAKLCLLNPGKKAAYDRQFPASIRAASRKPSARTWSIIAGALAASLVLLALVILVLSRSSEPPVEITEVEGGSSDTFRPRSERDSPRPVVEDKTLRPSPPVQPAADVPAVARVAPPVKPDVKPEADRPPVPLAKNDVREEVAGKNLPPSERNTLKPDIASVKPRTPEVEPVEPPVKSRPAVAKPATPMKPKRLPVPSEDVQKGLLADVDTIYHLADRKTPTAKSQAARDLYELAEKSRAESGERFVVLRKATELAADCGDVPLMLKAVDAIGAAYEFDSLAAKCKLLNKQAPPANDAARIKAFMTAANALTVQALAEDRCDLAEELNAATLRMCQKPLARPFRNDVHKRQADIQQYKEQWQAIQQAMDTIKTAPDDPEANLAVGRYYCLKREDWGKGLPYLAKGSDAALSCAARNDLQAPDDPAAQLQVADAWWELGSGAEGADREALSLRAAYWYKQLAGEAKSGLVRMKIQKRLEITDDIPRPVPGAPEGKMKSAVVNSIGMRLVLIPPGEFLMGSDDSDASDAADEKPQHRVRITRPFYMGACEVTQDEYRRIMGVNPSFHSPDGQGSNRVEGQDTSRFPVEMVFWPKATEFCARLSQSPEEQRAGRAYRLPTEAEWEYACRAGTSTPWFFGDDAAAYASHGWGRGNSGRVTHPVGEKKPNPWGLYDMHGNVFEWCADWYDEKYYSVSPVEDPRGPVSGSERVLRGGDYFWPETSSRSAARRFVAPFNSGSGYGFRVVMTQTR